MSSSPQAWCIGEQSCSTVFKTGTLLAELLLDLTPGPALFPLRRLDVMARQAPELTEKSADGSSDAGFVVSQLQAKCYFAMYSTVEALDYGSLARRKRIWCIAAMRNTALAKGDAAIEAMAVSLLSSMAQGEPLRDPATAIPRQRYGGRPNKAPAKADPITSQ